MQHSVNQPTYPIAKRQNPSRGYILITLMLFMALLTMAALAVLGSRVQCTVRARAAGKLLAERTSRAAKNSGWLSRRIGGFACRSIAMFTPDVSR